MTVLLEEEPPNLLCSYLTSELVTVSAETEASRCCPSYESPIHFQEAVQGQVVFMYRQMILLYLL